MYHKVALAPAGSKLKGHYVAPARFRSHVQLLNRLRFRGLGLGDAMARDFVGKAAVLTFDDGYVNFLEQAVPILESGGMKGTVFVVTGEIGGVNRWDVALGDTEEPLMSSAQIVEVARRGHEVGSHTVNHLRLTDTPEEEARRQVVGSREALTQLLGNSIASFCYPYGAENEQVVQWVREAGYRWGCSTRKGLNRHETPPHLLRRVNVRRETNVAILAYKLIREARRT